MTPGLLSGVQALGLEARSRRASQVVIPGPGNLSAAPDLRCAASTIAAVVDRPQT